MSVELAVKLFTAVPKKHNCAQAVADGCGLPDLAAGMASCGGGKAPEGMCGALYAALFFASAEDKKKMTEEFRDAAGSTLCREIKTVTGYPCCECVRTAASLVEKYRKNCCQKDTFTSPDN